MTLNIVYGNIEKFPSQVIEFIEKQARLLKPDGLHICDGSLEERKILTDILIKNGTICKLEKYDNCYLARTSPDDVARVESKTFMCTPKKCMSVPEPLDSSKGQLGNWANDQEMRAKLEKLLLNAMNGRIMYVLPFCMGPLGCEFSKIGVQLTDSPYVVLSMGIMTTMGDSTLEFLKDNNFIRCTHTVLVPLPLPTDAPKLMKIWPCNPKNTYITHYPADNEIISCGSGYGGNSLLGKKCFALRMAGNIAHKEGWLAEHMLILRLEKNNEKKYIVAAFPSACGKTNLAMLTPSLSEWKVTCVGDDIAWMKFDNDGVLRAINPERGFFGVCPGTSHKTNPIAMDSIFKDTIFTNVAMTSDSGVFWEGLEEEVDLKTLKITDWLGNENWTSECGHKAAHPNSRFCAPIRNCSILDPEWDSKLGVPISAIIFGGRRPNGVPLVLESFDWNHGVMFGAGVKSETTAAASDMKSNVIVHDPFAMRPFIPYNAGEYIRHWMKVGSVPNRKLPKIFHVNWFKKDSKGKFLWPGFCENIRPLEWIFRRCNNEDIALETPIGYVPKPGSLNIDGLDNIDSSALFDIDRSYFIEDFEELDNYFKQYLNKDYPKELKEQVERMKQRLAAASSSI